MENVQELFVLVEQIWMVSTTCHSYKHLLKLAHGMVDRLFTLSISQSTLNLFLVLDFL
jgi:hypothetical protein